MILAFDIADKAGLTRGKASMKLDWGSMKWTLGNDPDQIWSRVGFSKQGAFERKDWGTLWIWDASPQTGEKKNTFIVWDSPTREADTVAMKGQGCLFAPKDKAFKDAIIDWRQVVDTTAAAAPAATEGLTGARARVINQILPEVLDCEFPEGFDLKTKGAPGPAKGTPQAKYLLNPYNPHGKGAGTTCYTLPAYVALKLERPFRFPATTGLPKEGKRYNAWKLAKDHPEGPKPGDLYALCTGELKDENISHVGVIVDPSNKTKWVTADTGQGGGYAGRLRVERDYDATAVSLTGETHDGKKSRPLYGWVDIDLLVGAAKPK